MVDGRGAADFPLFGRLLPSPISPTSTVPLPPSVAPNQSHTQLPPSPSPAAMSDPFKAPLVPDATHASRASVPVATTAAATSSQARPPPIGPIGLLRQALSRLIESKVFYFDPFSEKVRQKSEEIRVSVVFVLLSLCHDRSHAWSPFPTSRPSALRLA